MKRLLLALATLPPLTMELFGQQKPAGSVPSFKDFPTPVTRPARIATDAFLDVQGASAYGKRYYVWSGGGLQLIQTVVDQAFTERIRKMKWGSDKKQR